MINKLMGLFYRIERAFPRFGDFGLIVAVSVIPTGIALPLIATAEPDVHPLTGLRIITIAFHGLLFLVAMVFAFDADAGSYPRRTARARIVALCVVAAILGGSSLLIWKM